MNTDTIVQIKKVRHNILLLKKYVDQDPVLIEESNKTVNLTTLYPTETENSSLLCDICNKQIPTIIFNKHYIDIHGKTKIHTCDHCNVSFKRANFFARHKCNKNKKNSNNKMSIHITKIESLTPIVL